MCKPDEWDSVGNFYDHAWGILDKSGKSSMSFTSIHRFVYISTKLASLFYVAKACLTITLEQIDFLERVWAIPFE